MVKEGAGTEAGCFCFKELELFGGRGWRGGGADVYFTDVD